jgi:endo-1,4-beta-xylanase
MGGFGAARLGFKYPDVFGVVSMFAPVLAPFEGMQDEMPLIVSDVWGDDRRYFAETDPWNLVAHNADKIRGKSKIRLYCGDQDRYAIYAQDFHARLDQLGIAHEYRLVKNGPHELARVLMGVRSRVLPFWKEVFPPYVPPATTQSTR